ncbi:MAG: glycosyltransferase family 4 protein [bacterium]|nr:glycosyltransferase family 4 protein [bacterium]
MRITKNEILKKDYSVTVRCDEHTQLGVKKLLMVGPKVGNAIVGAAVAFDLLADFLIESGTHVFQIDMTGNGTPVSGAMRVGRIYEILKQVLKSYLIMPRVSMMYLVISTSKPGFVKDFLLIWCALLLRRRVVLHLHGGGYRDFYAHSARPLKWLIRNTLGRADRIIVLGELLRDQFAFLNNRTSICVVPNGVSTDNGTPFWIPKEIPKKSQPWKFLYLSNMMQSKGYMVLFEACKTLVQRGQNRFHVDFCGAFLSSVSEAPSAESTISDEERFKHEVSMEPMVSFARYHGTVAGDNKCKLLRDAHFLILPTVYPWEGQPISIIEAMASGTPVISTRHAGIPEEVDDGKSGWLMNTDFTATTLADYLSQAMSCTTENYSDMSRQSREKYLREFTEEQYLSRMLSALTFED